jgi:hypothetical protein
MRRRGDLNLFDEKSDNVSGCESAKHHNHTTHTEVSRAKRDANAQHVIPRPSRQENALQHKHSGKGVQGTNQSVIMRSKSGVLVK